MPIQNSFLFTCVTLRTVSPERYSGSKLSPGALTTPESICLVLLRSRPDTVHRVSPRETQTSTPLTRGSFAKERPPCQIIPIVNACVDMALKLGMPEARIPLGDAAVLMATSPKSNSGHIALDLALADVRKGKTGDFPRHLQNIHADSYTMEREQGYLYPHDFPNHWVSQQYLPDALVGTTYYEYGSNKLEQAAKQYWDKIKAAGT